MEIAAFIGLGLALAIDASIVAFSCGLSAKEHHWQCPLRLALVAGAFQGIMPAIGFFAAGRFVHYVAAWSHWIAFGVFLSLGILFILNAWRKPADCDCKGCTRCAIGTWKGVFAVGVATSIDALAVGAGIACSESNKHIGIVVPAIVIAITTLFCVLAAFYATRFFHRLPTRLLGTIAGLILIALGVRAVLVALI